MIFLLASSTLWHAATLIYIHHTHIIINQILKRNKKKISLSAQSPGGWSYESCRFSASSQWDSQQLESLLFTSQHAADYRTILFYLSIQLRERLWSSEMLLENQLRVGFNVYSSSRGWLMAWKLRLVKIYLKYHRDSPRATQKRSVWKDSGTEMTH